MADDHSPPHLIMLTGPNGSGKSTFFKCHLLKWDLPFVNVDAIILTISGCDAEVAHRRAAKIADASKHQLIAERKSFVTEGLRADTNLIAAANAAGYRVRVVFICLNNSVLNVVRVEERVALGGHDVKAKALRLRYNRVLEAMPAVPALVTDFLMVDNSRTSFQLIARWKSGQLVRLRAKVPAWAERVFSAPFSGFRQSRQPHQI